MDADGSRESLDLLTRSIIGRAQRVSLELSNGFLEKVYENALAIELRIAGLEVRQQHPVRVFYRGQQVGEYFADLLVQDRVIVELKAVSALNDIHCAQCLNYLKASRLRICLLMNFAKPRLEVRRIVAGF
jgi:GxxExxY protein